MGKADDDATTPSSDGAAEPKAYSLGPFPVDALHQPDGALVSTFWRYWLMYTAETNGISSECLTQEMADAIARATLKAEVDDVAYVAVEKILRRIAGGAPGHEAKTAEMIRGYILDGAMHIAALDEAATGRRRQRANASKPRPDYLHTVLKEMVAKNPKITEAEALEKLRLHTARPDADPDGYKIECVDDAAGTVEWREPGKPTESALISGLKDRLHRAKKAVRKVSASR